MSYQQKLREAEEFRALTQHPGWKLLLDATRAEVVARWKTLRTVAADGLRYEQGYLDGMNFVLEYADAAVGDASVVIEAERADQASALAARIRSEQDRRARSQRAGGAWAEVSST